MSLKAAPFNNDVALGPDDVSAYWLKTDDGVQIRAAVWGAASAALKGCILLLPGRTEYIEKYGKTAQDLLERGYCSIAIDWRGQGAADRLLPKSTLGHVESFKDYQRDLQVVLNALPEIALPDKPLYLLAHSMGGCIGLRSLMEDLPVKAAAFTAPMWGIAMGKPKRAAAWAVSTAARSIGMDKQFSPGTSPVTYVLSQPYEDNMLTTDKDMFEYMRNQATEQPELTLGGPSLTWLSEGLQECRALRARPTPNIPCLTFLGTGERIVDHSAIHDRMARWPNGQLEIIEGAEHEVLMEREAIRSQATDAIVALFEQHT
ncbi:MAG: alpha/beta hydrolase [Litoreibacter sp.]